MIATCWEGSRQYQNGNVVVEADAIVIGMNKSDLSLNVMKLWNCWATKTDVPVQISSNQSSRRQNVTSGYRNTGSKIKSAASTGNKQLEGFAFRFQ